MNKIEQEIHDESYKDIIKEAKVIRINQAYSLLEKHFIGLLEFIKINNFVLYKDGLWYKKGNYSPLKQKEYFNEQALFKLYITQL